MAWLFTALLVGGVWVSPSFALTEDCIECHGTFSQVHGSINHTATPPSGTVRIFAATDHYPTGNFEIPVDCKTCHALDLLAVHANNCSNCHPTPYDTLGTWGRGCQQGGCHAAYHEDVLTAHKPFADPYDSEGTIRCENCHSPDWTVTQSNCLNCHASYGAGDLTPPITTVVNAQDVYHGTAIIVFSITDNSKVGIGTTFYRLDGGAEDAGSRVVVSTPGPHQLEFWSVDQAGNVESPRKQISFTISEDTTPPTTTSDARTSYNQGGIITLTATDDSGAVKSTYFTVNGGPVQTGTVFNIPATNGTISYTLTFWSEDWAGNIETPQSVSFTVTSGSGILRLVWVNADVDPTTGPAANDRATWYVFRGGWAGVGTLVAQGSGASPGWSGVDDVSVPVSSTPYFVRITWYVAADAWQEDTYFTNIYVTTPGEVIKLNY